MFFPTWQRLEADPFIGKSCLNPVTLNATGYADDHVSVCVSEYFDLFFPTNVALLLQLMRSWLLFFGREGESLRSFD